MKRFRLLPALLLLMAAGFCVSCVDHAYDFENTDTTAVIASEGISVPLGSTQQMTVESLFGDHLGDAVTKKADGSYVIHYDAGKFSADISGINDIDASVSFGGGSNPVEATVWLFDKPDVDLTLYPDEYVDLTDHLAASNRLKNHTEAILVTIPDIPEEIVGISTMTLASGAILKVKVSIPDCLLTEGTIAPDVKVDVSELLNLSGIVDNILKINDIVLSPENGYAAECQFPVQGIVFDRNGFDPKTHTLKLDADIKVSGSYKINAPATTKSHYMAAPSENDLRVSIELTDASISAVTGTFDYATSPIEYTYEMGNFAGKLGGDDAVLDFANPAILLDIKGALSIPVNAYLRITGLRNGSPVAASSSEMRIELPVSNAGTISKQLRVAKDGDIQYDLSALLRSNPDAIKFSVRAETDKTKSGTISKNADYWLDITPQIDIPVAFGPDLRLNFRDTMSLPSTVGSLIKNNALLLSGEVLHTLPLKLTFGFVMTDDAGNAITSPATSPEIPTGQKTAFEMKQSVSSPSAAERISKAILTFTLTASDANTSLNANQTVMLDHLAIGLPDGYQISLKK